MAKELFREPLTQEELNDHRATLNGEPAVYCGTYGKYNDGSIDGMWIDLTSFLYYDDFIEFCERLHADEEDPELMFQDFEGFPKDWYCESCMGEDTFEKILEYADLDDDMKEAYQAYLDHYDSKADLSTVQDRYQGHYNCPEDFAEQLYSEIYNIPDFLENFIDWSAVWRNLDTSGDYFEADGHIFSCY